LIEVNVGIRGGQTHGRETCISGVGHFCTDVQVARELNVSRKGLTSLYVIFTIYY